MADFPVRPNEDYSFRGDLKTETITSDTGMRSMVATISRDPAEGLALAAQDSVGSNLWTHQQLELRTGPKTYSVMVALRRLPNRKLNNLGGRYPIRKQENAFNATRLA